MICNTIFAVCKAYKNRGIVKDEAVPTIEFRKNRSIRFDKRTYSIKGNMISFYTLEGRTKVEMEMGPFQAEYFSKGSPKEGELICKKGRWYFNLVLDLPGAPLAENNVAIGVDLGENVIAAISSGEIIGGGKVRHERDKFLAKRRALQSNGSQSAKPLLKKISGKEERRMKQMNHAVSKQIVREAVKQKAGIIGMEDLTNIRKRIKAKKRMRTRLHRWAFSQLQFQIEYKARNQGIRVVYLNPAYSSQICSSCDLFRCPSRKHF